ncbi:MAG TPA: sigma-70 family RNA polymerase sigma factor [Candidatus Binatia bacterium]|nr:sigma-70 family RNA polymerase sigma factor [Candidatus Binatia bacterium]
MLLVRGMAAKEADGREKHALFEQWALPHKDYIYTACLYLTRNKEEAEDLFQETYLRAFRFFHQFTPGTNCRAWLLTIMHNAFKNRYPQYLQAARTLEFDGAVREYEKKLLADGEAGRDDPAEMLLSRLVDSEVADALRSLPEEYRSTLLLVDVEEMTYEEAAAALECPIGTVRSRLSRARRLLQAALATYARQRGLKKKGEASPAKAGTRL